MAPDRTLDAARRRILLARGLDRALFGVALGVLPGALLASTLGAPSVSAWGGALLGAGLGAGLAIWGLRRPSSTQAALRLDLAVAAVAGGGAARWATWVEARQTGGPFAEPLRARLAGRPLPAPLGDLVPLRPSRRALAAALGGAAVAVGVLVAGPAPARGRLGPRAARARLMRVVASMPPDAALAPLSRRVARLLDGRPSPQAVARVLEAVRAQRREAEAAARPSPAPDPDPAAAARPRPAELARLEASLAAWLRARGAAAAPPGAPSAGALAPRLAAARTGSARAALSDTGADPDPHAGETAALRARSAPTAAAPTGAATESPLPPALARVVDRYFEEVKR